MRARYDSFLSPKYNRNEIKVYSADNDTSLMSAQCNLAGLYKLESADEWQPKLPWDPVPIHTRPEESDMLVAMEAPCPKYDRLYAEVKEDDYFVNVIYRENAKFFKSLSEKTGWDIQDIEYIRALYSILYIISNYNDALEPAWTADSWFNKTIFTDLAGKAWARETWTQELKKLRAGPFLEALFSNFDDLISKATLSSITADSTSDAPKFTMVSTSTKALTSILNTMGVFENVPPGFADALIFELSHTPDNRNVFEMYYRDDHTKNVKPLILKGCPGTTCPYSAVKSLFQRYVLSVKEWRTECNEKKMY